jgi:pimeloyl-ACP methyl ester carboxylesterase
VLLFAKQHPERIRTLILSNPVDPALRSLEHIERKRFVHPDIDHQLKLDDIGTPAEELHQLRSKIASYFTDSKQGWAYAQNFNQHDANKALNVQIWEEYRKNPLTKSDVRKLAPRIGGLIFCKDDVLQPESLDEYKRILGDATHHVLQDCAHFPWEENPSEYFQALVALLPE